jgi:hypothetical protein
MQAKCQIHNGCCLDNSDQELAQSAFWLTQLGENYCTKTTIRLDHGPGRQQNRAVEAQER